LLKDGRITTMQRMTAAEFSEGTCGYAAQRDFKAGAIILQRALVGMPEFTPVETTTARHRLVDLIRLLLVVCR